MWYYYYYYSLVFLPSATKTGQAKRPQHHIQNLIYDHYDGGGVEYNCYLLQTIYDDYFPHCTWGMVQSTTTNFAA